MVHRADASAHLGASVEGGEQPFDGGLQAVKSRVTASVSLPEDLTGRATYVIPIGVASEGQRPVQFGDHSVMQRATDCGACLERGGIGNELYDCGPDFVRYTLDHFAVVVV